MDSKMFKSYFRPIGPEYRLETNGCGYTMNDPNTNANVKPVLYKLTKENHAGMRHWKDIILKDQSEMQDYDFIQSRYNVHKEQKPIQTKQKEVHAAVRGQMALTSVATQTIPVNTRSIECQAESMKRSPGIEHKPDSAERVRSNLRSPKFVTMPASAGLLQKRPTLVSAGTMTDNQTIPMIPTEYPKNDNASKVLQVSRATLTSPHMAPSPPIHREYPQMMQTSQSPPREVPYQVITVRDQGREGDKPTRIQYLNYKRDAFDWERQQSVKNYPIDDHPMRKSYPTVRNARDPLRSTYPRMYKAADGGERLYMEHQLPYWILYNYFT
ncbi:hypothetical protein CHS0354_012756 [Potamilus streckersoni]|uniref:Uncharacterized protein n=1 Tax=Potamilus streckersoni TaxID=2493646 RepID=A0AAE0VJ46_9BIVA|nr:hypothetical protein CHS0354_012756 [Potamilus streckersoni]